MKKGDIIECKKCGGSGEITKTTAREYGLFGVIFTAGVLNMFDKLSSQEWQLESNALENETK